jgi:hypothetical protein
MSQLPAQAHAAQPKLDESAAAGIRASLAAVVVDAVVHIEPMESAVDDEE